MSVRPFPSRETLTSVRPRLAFLLPVLLLATLLPAQARLGKTANQCEKIYGKPLGSTTIPGLIPNGLEYHRGEYSIICGFEENECTIVVVLRLSPQNPTAKEIHRDDMTLFMQDNFGQTNWIYTRFDRDGKLWKTYDRENHRSYLASYARKLHMLTLRVEQG
jgi:hypothetical protein